MNGELLGKISELAELVEQLSFDLEEELGSENPRTLGVIAAGYELRRVGVDRMAVVAYEDTEENNPEWAELVGRLAEILPTTDPEKVG